MRNKNRQIYIIYKNVASYSRYFSSHSTSIEIIIFIWRHYIIIKPFFIYILRTEMQKKTHKFLKIPPCRQRFCFFDKKSVIQFHDVLSKGSLEHQSFCRSSLRTTRRVSQAHYEVVPDATGFVILVKQLLRPWTWKLATLDYITWYTTGIKKKKNSNLFCELQNKIIMDYTCADQQYYNLFWIAGESLEVILA